MFPLSLLKTAQGHPMLVELKNGETYNGHLVNCDTWMNIHLREVFCTSNDGDRFWYMPKCYIRGNTIKYLRLPPSLGRGRARGREEAEEGLEEAGVETEGQEEDEEV
ncbi:putative sm-like protein Lsm4 [Medicago truncatula]|uniref:U6 snRNA-associated Sm-like protein LSm4 n=1 Tax=Medicago truncatula TaxID=3880 RepID=G7IF82_MEDTR|nr:u6 snRNA-associated-like-Smprotein [Medicago truncatula]RHN81131.1 putative sm-like protein Lsm4 [Medicago truncatula]